MFIYKCLNCGKKEYSSSDRKGNEPCQNCSSVNFVIYDECKTGEEYAKKT